LTVIDLSREPVADSRLAGLAKAGGGRLSRATTADDIRWALLETLTGQPQLVARDASLTVTFNPKSVLGYRLLGHEATLLAAPPQADLRAGQTGVGLYEIQLKPQGEELVATARVTWRDPATGQPRSLSQRINRSAFAGTFSAEPASLQLATLAAETAELLRRSPFREINAYGPLKDLAAEATSPARQSRSYDELVAVIRDAPRAKPASSNLRRAWSRLPSR
jgi:Ca-activated chloride channel family protein